jgi:NAD(P)-dependent dehydrogenase (short-subunit alcohol dehydrogenase family)
MASKVWFITGTSKGFGRVWAEAALARGDRVAATAAIWPPSNLISEGSRVR